MAITTENQLEIEFKTLIVKGSEKIRELLNKNNHYCPCKFERIADNACMCKEFRLQDTEGKCHCGLYEKVRRADSEKETLLAKDKRTPSGVSSD
jgi:hypothetical protein